MADPTPPADAGKTQGPPVIPSGQEIYDSIMGKIEPELTTEGLKTIKEKYKDETPEQEGQRKLKYQKAFEEYDTQYKTYMFSLHAEVDSYRKTTIQSLEDMNNKKEADQISAIESAMASI